MLFSFKRLKRLPTELWIALVATIGIFLLNVLWSLNQAGWKLDQGTATLLGAIIGLSIVARQARRGFANLIKSQAHQAQIDRDARLHQSELNNQALDRERIREKHLLLAALRAEIAALHSLAYEQANTVRTFALMTRFLAQNNAPASSKEFGSSTFNAPIFMANIPKLGLLGTYLGADIIKVLSRADGKSASMKTEIPMPHAMVYALYVGRHDFLVKWASDLHHVAMRIIAEENGTTDPGTLVATEADRYSKLEGLPELKAA